MIGGQVPFGPVMTASDIFAYPHFQARGMLAEVAMAGADRPLHVANTPVRMAHAAHGVRQPAPLTGEHGAAILAEFGFAAEEIAQICSDPLQKITS